MSVLFLRGKGTSFVVREQYFFIFALHISVNARTFAANFNKEEESKMKAKPFKDYELSDFLSMTSLATHPISATNRPFFGFNNAKDSSMSSGPHPTSSLADVL